MSRFRRRISALVGIIVCFILAVPAAPAGIVRGQAGYQGYEFAYIDGSGSRLTFYTINPITGVPAPRFLLDAPNGYPLVRAFLSPTGRYAVLGFGSAPQIFGLALLDIKTATYTVIANPTPLADYAEVAWSPDGMNFTYLNRKPNLYRALYNAVNLKATPLPTMNSLVEGRFSPDGRRLAGITARTRGDGQVEYSLTIFTLATGRQDYTAPVTVLSPFQVDPICGLAWSPDGTALAFATPCDDSAPSEVFVVGPGGLSQVSKNGAALIVGDIPVRTVTRNTLNWFERGTLFVGSYLEGVYNADPAPKPPRVASRTAAHEIISGRSIPLIATTNPVAVLEWAQNPTTGVVAFRARESSTEGAVIREWVGVGTYDQGKGILPTGNYAPGCDFLRWSPDGGWLAYRELSQYCWEQRSLTIIEANSGAASQVQIVAGDMQYVVLVGWVFSQ
ncbi:MAG: PD40 domain-containing protein [Anaerolineales bacterium]|nr:PD40 domain-containing protein [Anaerolineales bacterium]